jgi:hypothetical protein
MSGPAGPQRGRLARSSVAAGLRILRSTGQQGDEQRIILPGTYQPPAQIRNGDATFGVFGKDRTDDSMHESAVVGYAAPSTKLRKSSGMASQSIRVPSGQSRGPAAHAAPFCLSERHATANRFRVVAQSRRYRLIVEEHCLRFCE